MWGLTASTRVFLRAGRTDLRLGFDGLFGLARSQLGQDPLSGHLFVFCNGARTRLKILYWDGTGLWVCAKRLEQGTFAWPAVEHAALAPAELHALLAGLEVRKVRRWYRR
jgi:transposase